MGEAPSRCCAQGGSRINQRDDLLSIGHLQLFSLWGNASICALVALLHMTKQWPAVDPEADPEQVALAVSPWLQPHIAARRPSHARTPKIRSTPKSSPMHRAWPILALANTTATWRRHLPTPGSIFSTSALRLVGCHNHLGGIGVLGLPHYHMPHRVGQLQNTAQAGI